MKYIIGILVQNHAGVLSRVSGLFSRRGFNIDSLAVGPTQDEDVSRITIVVDGDEYIVDQVMKQLGKLIDVIEVKDITANSVARELVLIKVNADSKTRSEIMQIANVFQAKVVDITTEFITIEATGNSNKTLALEEMLRQFGIKEMVRTGVVAIERGAKSLGQQ
ncbi:acetolactate synthase small subunit [Mahella australiensis]|uniref:Acetolactate synthase small subunit n=1 Tax=Mahella australiensis (strain DSM 15567 / CIP 107919 / 50-1 BON) TaxID=697281 RepID=F3ZZR1_MAHA5|nr:acetolactate synthase small subunit [Mahella australiensis]AEE97908.1 acetolactate synthase, small subunit [Mahella australiensis 50-1 BON]